MKKSVFFSKYYYKHQDDVRAGKTDVPLQHKSIEYAAQDGFDGIELFPTDKLFSDDWLDDAKRYREELDANNICCPCFSHGLRIFNDPEKALKELKRCVDICEVLGTPNLHHTLQLSLSHENLPVYQVIEPTIVEVSREVAEYAGEKGICCIYEDQGFLFNTVDRLGGFIAKVGCENTGFCLDVGNSFWYDTLPEEFAAAFGSITKHVHIKDYIYKSSYPGKRGYRTLKGNFVADVPTGFGVVDFEKVFTILLKNGYDGFFSVEETGVVNQHEGLKYSVEVMQYYYDRAKENVNIK